MSDAAPAPKCEEGAPPWVMTFADLMSLLMTFFVLLLSFSEMDVLKFKQIAGSMEAAFGVQREVKVRDIPKGTSIVKQEFSPGKPEPTVLNVVRQKSTLDLSRLLDTEEKNKAGGDEGKSREALFDELARKAREDAEKLREQFAEELRKGLLEVGTDGHRILLRIREKGSFGSGRADLQPGFEPILERIGQVLARSDGQIVVAGHTDNVPISTARFRSNWELSAARAVTVVHYLQRKLGIPAERFLVEGHADADPLAPNETPEGRARNRRVEIVIIKGTAEERKRLARAGKEDGATPGEPPAGSRGDAGPPVSPPAGKG